MLIDFYGKYMRLFYIFANLSFTVEIPEEQEGILVE